jgi:putative tryptophan/tyrosine transport system substrate-binding protein
MRRREFITLLGGVAAAWPLAAGAQQPALPVVGFLHDGSADSRVHLAAAFRQGLAEAGFVDRRNVMIEYRWADDQFDRLPALVAELVQRPAAVIATPGSAAAAVAAKAATATIPIVFSVGFDPVKLGLVDSLNRPGRNVTGVSYFTQELGPKRLGLLQELMPRGADIFVLVNPKAPATGSIVNDMQAAASAVGQQLSVLNVSTIQEMLTAFPAMAQRRAPAFVVIADPLFTSRRVQLVLLATRYAVPAVYSSREFADIGGLMSYGTDLPGVYRQVGSYAGHILKGAKPADLPVLQPTKFELVINLAAAKVLKLEVPTTLLARADEVIE